MQLPTITKKQQAIIQLLYRYRFLKQKQLQQFLRHQDKRRSSRWLKDLKDKQYIDWFYEPDNPATRTTPAMYFLDINGIRWLRENSNHPETELRKRYKDSTRQPDFMSRCLLIADCALQLEARSNDPTDAVRYNYALSTDYFDLDNDYAFLLETEAIRPDLIYEKEMPGKDDKPIFTTSLVELIDPTTPDYMLRKKLKAYVSYLASDEWEQTKSSAIRSDELPAILIACPTLADLIKAKRYTRKQLAETWDGEEVPEEVKIRFSVLDTVRTRGVTAKIWEQA